MPRQRDNSSPTIGDPVRFSHRGRIIEGHLLQRQGRQRLARVIDTEERTWRVPESALQPSDGTRRTTLVTQHDTARAAFRIGDRVTFTGTEGIVRGKIEKLNPKRARIRNEAGCWDVPYSMLHDDGNRSERHGVEKLNQMTVMARRLMDEHGLADWTLMLVESKHRLGDCSFRDRVIRISRRHVLDGSAAQIQDTVLHEIAHAIAGPAAGHGPLWKAVARRIGATPRASIWEKDAFG